MGQFSFPKENRNCGWQKPRCSVHLHFEGPVIMSWPRHPEASHSLATHPGDLVGLARLLGNEQTCAETRGFPRRGRRAVIALLEQIGSSRQEARSLPVSISFGILPGVGRN